MNMVTEWRTTEDAEPSVYPPGTAIAVESLASADLGEPEIAEVPEPGAPSPADSPAGQPAALLAEISGTIRELADSTERYHSRAEQRESVIDHLHAEVDRLRRGERRGLLRPLLVEICRLRNDLLRQADELPDDFDAERARLLLCSYAESVELALESSGVISFAPASGDPFDPRMHRRVAGATTSDPALVGRVAEVRRGGYLDVDAASPIAPAEVVLFGPETHLVSGTSDIRTEQ
jgi:molecular chaperone GrpE